MKKRILASLLSLCLIVGLLPTAVLAADESGTEGESPAVCTCTALCAEGSVDETCPVCAEDYNSCAYEEVPAEPAEEPEGPACAGLEGCDGDTHAEGCPLYVEPEEPADAQAGDKNTYYETDDVTAPVGPTALNSLADDEMSGNCGNPTYVDGDTTPTDKVKWELTQNNDDSGDPTYTLTFTGTGDITWEWRTQGGKRPPYYSYASQITKVVFGEGITGGARAACAGFTALTEVSLPSTFSQMGNDMFSGCTNLTSIDLPASLTSIGNSAFNNCTSLSSVNFAQGTGEIKINGFYNCTSLKSITLPDKVTSIGPNAFQKSGLESITIDPSVNCGIGQGAFSNCTSLTGVTIGENVTSIGKQAFYSDAALTTVSISAKEIGEQVFGQCTALTNVTLNEGVTTIGNNAFATTKGDDKGSLKVLRLPSTITSIGTGLNEAYMLETLDMSAATNITFPSSNFSLGMNGIVYVSTSEIATALKNADNRDVVAIAVTNGGNFAENQSFTENTFAAPIQNGKIFAGWYDNADFTGNSVTNPTDKDEGSSVSYGTYYAKWIELKHEGITLEYGSTSSSFPTIDGVALTDWTSANPDVVKIENGKMIATGVGDTTITANAAPTAARSGETLTVSVTVTPKKITVSMENATVNYDEQPHTIEAKPAEGGTLPEDLELVYSYKESNASDNEYIHVAPSHPGTYIVKVESGNPNYELTGTTIATLTISEPQQEQDVSDHVTVTAPSLVYDGKAKVYTAAYEGITDWTIAYYDTEGTRLDSAPVNAGDYWVTINGDGAGVYASITKSFTIDKATVTIRPNDKSAYVGDAVPVLGENDYTMTGLVGDDTLSTKPTLAYEGTPDMSKTGTYTIKASGAVVGPNYEISYKDGTLTVSRRSSGGGSSSSGSSSGDYTVSVDADRHGTVTVSPKRADKGDTVTITVKPDKGYELDELTVTDKSGDTIKIKDKGNGKFTFTMPGSKVTVEANFKQIDAEPEVPAFADVPADAYYADAVAWAVKEGITSGTSAATFTPNASCTRAQMVTFLWRANGSPKASGGNPFTDVNADAYYYDAVLWAAEKGITSGTTATTFSPNATLTRGQTVTFLWRANGAPAVSGGSFGDVASDAYYANAVAWAVSEGITSGTGDNNFSPEAPCTRAQIVTFMYRDAQ